MFDRPLVAKLHLKLPRGRNLRALRVHIQVVSAYQGSGNPFTNPKAW